MTDQDDKESVLSKFSNQDPASGGYGEEEPELAIPTKPSSSAAAKAKKKKKNKAAKKARKKNRR